MEISLARTNFTAKSAMEEKPMNTNLSRQQKKLLKFYARFEERQPRFLDMVRNNALPWSLNVYGIAVGTVLIWFGSPLAGWIGIAYFVGAWTRDLDLIRVYLKTWPLFQEILNWNHIRDLNLLIEHEQPAKK